MRFRYSTILTATLTFQASFVHGQGRRLLTWAGHKIPELRRKRKPDNADRAGNDSTCKGSKLLVVNVVDTGSNDAAQNIIKPGKERNVPVIFFNRSVEESVVSSCDKCVFVGTDLRNGRTYAGRNDRQIPG